jgi:hypothetical protein
MFRNRRSKRRALCRRRSRPARRACGGEGHHARLISARAVHKSRTRRSRSRPRSLDCGDPERIDLSCKHPALADDVRLECTRQDVAWRQPRVNFNFNFVYLRLPLASICNKDARTARWYDVGLESPGQAIVPRVIVLRFHRPTCICAATGFCATVASPARNGTSSTLRRSRDGNRFAPLVRRARRESRKTAAQGGLRPLAHGWHGASRDMSKDARTAQRAVEGDDCHVRPFTLLDVT